MTTVHISLTDGTYVTGVGMGSNTPMKYLMKAVLKILPDTVTFIYLDNVIKPNDTPTSLDMWTVYDSVTITRIPKES